MPTYIFKGGSIRIVNGIRLQNRGDEIELDSLNGLVNANRFVLKKEQPVIVKKPVILKPAVETPLELEKIKPEVKTKGGIN